jgi:hypothetical protein
MVAGLERLGRGREQFRGRFVLLESSGGPLRDLANSPESSLCVGPTGTDRFGRLHDVNPFQTRTPLPVPLSAVEGAVWPAPAGGMQAVTLAALQQLEHSQYLPPEARAAATPPRRCPSIASDFAHAASIPPRRSPLRAGRSCRSSRARKPRRRARRCIAAACPSSTAKRRRTTRPDQPASR